MRKITVVDGHPDAARGHLVHALADRYVEAARAAGHEVRRITVAELDVPVLRVPADFTDRPAPPPLQAAQRDVVWADHLAFFFPLWHADMPALLKAFLEQVLRPGVAMAYAGDGRMPKKLFVGKSARIVVTMAMPPAVYRVLLGAHAVRGLAAMLRSYGVGPVRTSLFGLMRLDRKSGYGDWVARMDRLVACDGRMRRIPAIVPAVGRLAATLAAGYGAYRLATRRLRF